jgi:DNA replication and repair protein RecF
MHLTELRIQNFRCIATATLEPAAALNLITGDNASGKSSLLEAIYFLGRTQSFRGTPSDRLIRTGEAELSVFGRLQDGQGDLPVGVLRSGHHTRIKLGTDERAGVLELVSALPVQVIDPRLHQLLEEGPEQRRRFLDWGVFHVEQRFYAAWLRYQRSLRQRNCALRDAKPADAALWDRELVAQGEQVHEARAHYLAELGPALRVLFAQLFEQAEVSVEYQRGWPAETDLAESLARSLSRDAEAGYTQAGPHRADLKIRLQGRQARTRASRGEQKLIAAGLLLAQARLLMLKRGRRPILLIDDLAAELDAQSRARLLSAIQSLGAQTFLTFLEPAQIPRTEGESGVFHVEHGRLRRQA